MSPRYVSTPVQILFTHLFSGYRIKSKKKEIDILSYFLSITRFFTVFSFVFKQLNGKWPVFVQHFFS